MADGAPALRKGPKAAWAAREALWWQSGRVSHLVQSRGLSNPGPAIEINFDLNPTIPLCGIALFWAAG